MNLLFDRRECCMWFGFGAMWLAIAGAVSVGIYYTKSIHCLWFLGVGLLITFQSGGKSQNSGSEQSGKSGKSG